jgi:hypothetical protein
VLQSSPHLGRGFPFFSLTAIAPAWGETDFQPLLSRGIEPGQFHAYSAASVEVVRREAHAFQGTILYFNVEQGRSIQ